MSGLTSWIQRNKLSTVLILLFIFLFGRDLVGGFTGVSMMRSSTPAKTYPAGADMAMMSAPAERGGFGIGIMPPAPPVDAPPPSTSGDRLIVRNSTLSLVVKDVSSAMDAILSRVDTVGGFMIQSNLSNPETAGTGTLSVRVPTDRLDETLVFLRSQSVKVVSEQTTGTDVTDQFEDIEERLRILRENKVRMEEIMRNATRIPDIVDIQQQVFNLQSQIDSLVGRQQYLLRTSQLSSVTVYLSTDEFSLPYTPDEPWRPDAIFKQAVRSLVGTLRGLASTAIWLGVYSVIIIPAGVLFVVIKRKMSSRRIPPSPKARNDVN